MKAALGLFLLALGSTAFADGGHKTWKDTSSAGVVVLTLSALAVPTEQGDWQGLEDATFSLGLGEGIALAGKSLVQEERPNHEDDHSFPSGHATLAFAAATTMYRRYGWEFGAPAYAVAALTGYARFAAKEHHWWDVVAGAGFGVGAGWLMTQPLNKNVQLTPLALSKGAGLVLNVTW
jgi:membrane-associated phospholipid phosphatase